MSNFQLKLTQFFCGFVAALLCVGAGITLFPSANANQVTTTTGSGTATTATNIVGNSPISVTATGKTYYVSFTGTLGGDIYQASNNVFRGTLNTASNQWDFLGASSTAPAIRFQQTNPTTGVTNWIERIQGTAISGGVVRNARWITRSQGAPSHHTLMVYQISTNGTDWTDVWSMGSGPNGAFDGTAKARVHGSFTVDTDLTVSQDAYLTGNLATAVTNFSLFNIVGPGSKASPQFAAAGMENTGFGVTNDGTFPYSIVVAEGTEAIRARKTYTVFPCATNEFQNAWLYSSGAGSSKVWTSDANGYGSWQSAGGVIDGVTNALAGPGLSVGIANKVATYTNTGVLAITAGPNLSLGNASGTVTLTNTYKSYATNVTLGADINPSVADTYTNIVSATVPQISGAVDGTVSFNYRTDGSGVPNYINYEVLAIGGGTTTTVKRVVFSRDVQNNGNAQHTFPFMFNLTTNVTIQVNGKVDSASAGDVWTSSTPNIGTSAYTNINASQIIFRYFPTSS